MSQVSKFRATHFADFALMRRLADEGSCEVWLVVSPTIESNHPDGVLFKLKPETVKSAEFRQRFLLEGRRVKQMVHPCIARVREVLVEGADVGIVVDATSGPTLRHIVEMTTQCENTVPLWFAVHVTKKVCDALCVAHAHTSPTGRPDPVFHLHLGLDHVVVGTDGAVAVYGFGLALTATRESWIDDELEACSLVVRNTRNDLTAVAKLLYQMLTRVTLDDALPSSSTLKRLVVSALAPTSIYSPWVPRSVDTVLRRALSPYGRDGYSSVAQFRDALLECLPDAQKDVTDEQLGAVVEVLERSVSKGPGTSSPRSISPFYSESRDAEAFSDTHPQSGFHTTRSDGSASGIDGDDAGVTDEDRLVGIGSSTDGVGPFEVIELEARSTAPESVPPISERINGEGQSAPSSVKTGWFETTLSNDDAIRVFEQGLDCLRAGDYSGAEAAWVLALELDPDLRTAATNLNLLRKRRNSEYPPA